MMRLIGHFIEGVEKLSAAGTAPEMIAATPVLRSLMRMGEEIPEGAWEQFSALEREIDATVQALLHEPEVTAMDAAREGIAP